ncbi:hypothetical protein N7G274_010512 [Stereocaulon virgatum]|uniref:J domain-containing protein n=1 Tax=Stereocaulon virgatum TaxID=373712 RepID=A0ABR4A0E1_9LECA
MAPPAAKTFYDVLEVERHAQKPEIKLAYKKLALQRHPDKNHGAHSAVADFQELGEAYEVLSDDNRRILYDKTLPKVVASPFRDTKHKPSAGDASRDASEILHEMSEMLRKEREKIKAAELKRKQEAKDKERKKAAEDKRKEREALEEAAKKAESARARVVETLRRERETREREIKAMEAEKFKMQQGKKGQAAAHQAKSNVAKGEQEWILIIEVKINVILTMKLDVKTLENLIRLLERNDCLISSVERDMEGRARISATVWKRSPEDLEKKNARARKDRLAQITGTKLQLEQNRKELKKAEAEYALQLCQESQERQKAARKVEVKMRDMNGAAQAKIRLKGKWKEETEKQRAIAEGMKAMRHALGRADEYEEMRRQRQIINERKEQREKNMKLEAEEKQRKEQEAIKKHAAQEREEKELLERRLEELNKPKPNAGETPFATINIVNGAANYESMSVVDDWKPAPATRAAWKKYGRCCAIIQRGIQCTQTLNCNHHRCVDSECRIPWNHTAHDGSVTSVSKTIASNEKV